jgi:phage major head subunit gpT-like protein
MSKLIRPSLCRSLKAFASVAFLAAEAGVFASNAGTRWDPNAVLKDLTLIVEDTVTITRPNLYPLITSMKEADGAYTRIPIANNVAMPRKFEGERSAQGKDVTIVQSYEQGTYELTIDIDADLLRDGKAYDQSDLVREAAMSAVQFPDYLTSQLVINGATQNGYDGVTFYDETAAHQFAGVGANKFANAFANTGQTLTAIAADLMTAVGKIKSVKDSAGRLLNQQAKYGAQDLLIQAPVAMEYNFRQLLHSGFIPVAAPVTTSGTAAVGGTNVWVGQADLFVDGYLDASSTSSWYLHYVSRPQRPFVFIEDYGLQQKVLGLDSEFCTNTNKVRIALKHRFVLGYYRTDRSVKVV